MDNNTSKIDLTVKENIYFWKKLFFSSIDDSELLSLLDILEIQQYENILVKYLSFGEKRKLELCRLVIEQKKLWLLDEPYLGLDSSIIKILSTTFTSHINNGGMILFASHYDPQIRNIEKIDLENYVDH